MTRLLIYFAGIGDLVFLVPLFRALAETGDLDLLTRPYGKPLFAGQSFVRETHTLRHPNRGKTALTRRLLGAERIRLGRRLAACGYDEIIVFGQERRVITDWVEGWRGPARLRVMLYPEGASDRVPVGLTSLGLVAGDHGLVPRLDVGDAERAAARERLAPLGERVVGIQLGSGPANRLWRRRPNVKALTPAQWAGLISRILDADEADAIVFNGTAFERRDVDRVRALVSGRHRAKLHDWTGRTGLGELRGLLSTYRAFVSTDTGPAHIAAAVGCPLLVFFGPADPNAYLMQGARPVEMVLGAAPCQFCAGTRRYKTCRDNICLNRIPVDDLVEGWERLLRKEAA